MATSSATPKPEKSPALVNRQGPVNHHFADRERDFLGEFPDDKACLDYLMQLSFGTHIKCPKCRRTGKFHKIRKIPAYACQWCGYHLHPMARTRFARSRIGLRVWFHAVYLYGSADNGISARQLQRKLGVTYKSAWRMRNTIIDAKFELADVGSVSSRDEFERLLAALISPADEAPARRKKVNPA